MPEVGPDIGATLRETRMRARIDIGEVEMRTKIRAKYLRAIENEEWDLLPGPIYVKSFLRTYGDYLGLDSRLLVDEYKRRYEFAPDAQGRPLSAVKRERERERSRRGPRAPVVPSWAIIGLVLVVAAAALYVIGRGNGSSTPKATRSARGGTAPVTSITHTTAAPVTTATRTTPAAPKQATLKLVPTGSTWVCVQTASGATPIDGVIESTGTTVPALKSAELLVRLGNTQMSITADGRTFALKPSKYPVNLKITPTGVTTTTRAPTCA